jgi:hypothetical protein
MARQSNAAEDVVSGDALNQMPWQEFEAFVRDYFRRRGYTVADPSDDDADDCVDFVVTREGRRYLVQCKQVRELRIDVKALRELYGVTAARRAAGCFVVTSGDFTAQARHFAAPLKMGLIDGERLARALAERPKPALEVEPSGRREPRLDKQWAANAAESARRPSIELEATDELDGLVARRSLYEEYRRREKRSSGVWFTALAGICAGGLLFYLFVTLSEIGPPKELARPAEARQAGLVVGNEPADRKGTAWQRFYQPSEACRAELNRGSFACVSEQVRAKVEFEVRWLVGQI